MASLLVDSDEVEGQQDPVKEFRQPDSGESDGADVVLDVDDVGVALGGAICRWFGSAITLN